LEPIPLGIFPGGMDILNLADHENDGPLGGEPLLDFIQLESFRRKNLKKGAFIANLEKKKLKYFVEEMKRRPSN